MNIITITNNTINRCTRRLVYKMEARFYTSLVMLAIFFVSSCSQKQTTYTVVISMDAFRWDYPDSIDTPNLKKLSNDGVHCIIEPSYPASTFPNHYTIATGLVPDHHGIVNSSFWNPDTRDFFSMLDSTKRYNPEYYKGEPIWVTAEKSGIKTACIYWVGSDVPIKGVLPTYYHLWSDEPHLSYADRAKEVIRLLSLPPLDRPHLVMLYFDEPDGTSHRYGPFANETKTVIRQLDSIVGNMCDQLHSLSYGKQINIIITSDHGMTEISENRFIDIDDYIKPSWCEHIVGTCPTNIYAKDHCIDSILYSLNNVEHISVWRHGEVPNELHYGFSNRTGDVIVAPDLGWQFASTPRQLASAHGYSPQEKDMQVIFIANGPSFKKGYMSRKVEFKNVDIYPLLADILGIKPVQTDGDIICTKQIRK